MAFIVAVRVPDQSVVVIEHEDGSAAQYPSREVAETIMEANLLASYPYEIIELRI